MTGMEPLMVMAMVGTAAGSALQAGGAIMAGQEAARAAAFEREQLKVQEQQARTAASQAETAKREELTTTLESIQAIRAGRGLSLTSPTADAFSTKLIGDVERDITIERVNYLTRADLASRAAEMAARRGQTSLLAGYLGAGEALAGGLTRVAGIKRYAGFGPTTKTPGLI